jgi:PEGA domain-containing protein
MTPVPVTANEPEAPLFTDGLGDRVVAVDAATGDLLQILRVRPQLIAVPSFEFALRERAARLANFRHAYYGRVRRIDRHPSGLAIVSDHVEGVRLSDMLRVSAERGIPIDLNAGLCLLRQLVPSVALLHENARDVAHGLLAPERLIVTPRARVIIVEHVLGSAVEQLQYSRERLWHDLRVAAPVSVGSPRFDHRADVTGIGLVALALVLGRPIADDEYPHRLGALLNSARARAAGIEDQPLPDALHNWIARALHLDVKPGFQSATEAQTALEDALIDDSGFVPAPVALETFLSRYGTLMLEPSMPVPPAPVAPPPIAIVSPVIPAVQPEPVAPAARVPEPIAASIVARKAEPELEPEPAPVPEPIPTPIAVRTPTPTPTPTPAPVPVRLPVPRDLTELLRDLEPPVPAAPPKVLPQPALHGRGASRWRRIALVGLAVVALGEGGFIAARGMRKAPPPKPGTLSMQTNPPGVAVFVDGVAHGNTPARVTLEAGAHIIELRGRGVPRVIPVTVTAGAEVSQYLELPETPSLGSLLVQSEPAGARVSIDGADHGRAPVSVADLTPGEHEVVLQADGGPAVRQRVLIQAGVTSSVLTPVATAAPGPVSGWLAVKSPVAIEIRENGQMLGTTDADRIMMAAGRHEIELVNDTLGYRVTRAIQVPPGKVASLTVELPQGVINVNASPWAEVWIDGRRVGETPIGNLPMSIGPHEVVFRHPQLGEKRQAVSVTLKAPVRLSVEMK